jgi:hypothetical protein
MERVARRIHRAQRCSKLLPACIAGIGLGAALLYLSSQLSVLVLVSASIVFAFHGLTLGHLKKRVRAFRQSFEQFSTGALFAIRAIDLTRLHAAEVQRDYGGCNRQV